MKGEKRLKLSYLLHCYENVCGIYTINIKMNAQDGRLELVKKIKKPRKQFRVFKLITM